ncbi:hypothetical protein [Alloactinosynnema sp. L-07]|nr:hypothetical protein [Alloactinosynnema sp. L-07]
MGHYHSGDELAVLVRRTAVSRTPPPAGTIALRLKSGLAAARADIQSLADARWPRRAKRRADR